MAVWEWARMSSFSKLLSYGAITVFALLAFVSYFWLTELTTNFWIFFLPSVIWVAISVYLINAAIAGHGSLLGKCGAILKGPIACVGLLLGAFVTSSVLLVEDPALLLLIFITIWVADAAAYFVGRRWGKHKLAPSISPGKTWEGVAGALVFSGCSLFIATKLMTFSHQQTTAVVLLGLISVVASVVGDLFESLLKRSAGVKDSGTILPGHGGVLDRIDGLIAAVPIYSLGIFFWISKL